MYLEVWEPCADCAGSGYRGPLNCAVCNPYPPPVSDQALRCHPGYTRRFLPLSQALAALKEQAT